MPYEKLIKLPDDELFRLYDEQATHTQVGLNYYTEEIARRRSEKSNDLMICLTKWITIMTGVMLLSTIVNVIVAIVK
jgi:hypothetical protein